MMRPWEKPPCYGCDSRTAVCHAQCPEYELFAAERAELCRERIAIITEYARPRTIRQALDIRAKEKIIKRTKKRNK